MKKMFILATAVGLALTGCVSEEVVNNSDEQMAIGFLSPMMPVQSRAYASLGEITGTSFPTTQDFVVNAIQYPLTTAYSTDFWTNNTYTHDINGKIASNISIEDVATSNWGTSTTYNWPHAKQMAFAGYSPSDADDDGTFSQGESLIITDFTLQDNPAEQYDLMYSGRAINKTQSPVALTFHHALSSIVFSAKKENDTYDYQITSFVLSGAVKSKGNFSHSFNSDKTTPTTPIWDLDGTTMNLTYNLTTAVTGATIGTDGALITSGTTAWLTLPQDVPDDLKITISYTKTDSSDNTETKSGIELKLKDFINSNNPATRITSWNPGHRYCYHLHFGSLKEAPIYFQPNLSNWINDGSDNAYVELD